MRLLSSEQSLWNKEINITLTLKELQELYCALGITSFINRRDEWDSLSSLTCPFNNNSGLYDELEEILREQGGRIH